VIAIGIGLLKPNCSAMVAALYPEGGARRDAGFSAFYMGINLGALIGPILVGWFARGLGYKWGFVLPAVGMAIGLTQFIWTRHYLRRAGWRPRVTAAPGRPIIVLALLVAAVAGGGHERVLRINAVTLPPALPGRWRARARYFIYLLFFGGLSAAERSRTLVMIGAVRRLGHVSGPAMSRPAPPSTCLPSVYTDRHIFGWDHAGQLAEAVDPLFVILFAPVFALPVDPHSAGAAGISTRPQKSVRA